MTAPGALAVSCGSACFDLGASAAFNRMLESPDSRAREAYDLGEKLLDHVVDVASQWLPLLPGAAGSLLEDLFGALSVSDAAESAWTLRCAGQASSSLSAALRAAPVQEFCALFDPGAPPAEGRVFASVTIPGASRWQWFRGARVDGLLFVSPVEGTSCPKVEACTLEACFGPDGGAMENDRLVITFDPGLACSHVYDLARDRTKEGVIVVYDSPNIGAVGNLSSVSGTLTLTRFGSQAGRRLKGSFDAGLEGSHVDCVSAGDCTTTTRTGRAVGTFDVVIEAAPGPRAGR